MSGTKIAVPQHISQSVRISSCVGCLSLGHQPGAAGITALSAVMNTAVADPSGAINLFSLHADNPASIAAVVTTFAVEPGKAVRLTIYDSKETFLETASAKIEATINEDGIAVAVARQLGAWRLRNCRLTLMKMADGKLNRG